MTAFLNWKYHGFISLPVRFYLGFVFLFACWHKIIEPHAFAIDVATYQILPLYLINITAIFLPWLELVAGSFLVIGLRSRASSLLIGFMMLVFIVALGFALSRDLNMSCGCFASQGAEYDPISWKTMLRDSAWLFMAIYIFLCDKNPIGVESFFRKRSH